MGGVLFFCLWDSLIMILCRMSIFFLFGDCLSIFLFLWWMVLMYVFSYEV